MTIRNILVHVDSTDQSAKTVETAAALARNFDARLNGFYVMPDVMIAAAGPDGGAMSAQIVDDLKKDAERWSAEAEKIYRGAQGELPVAGGWRCANGMGERTRRAAAQVAFCTDLVVVGRSKDDDENATSALLPQDIVVDSGRPLLFLPPEGAQEPLGKNIMIAWSETREASRAAFDSLPFLAAADTVTLVTVVKNDDDTAPVDNIAGALEDHGLTPAVDKAVAGDGQKTSEALFDHAKKIGADLIVAGAYSHSRLREGLFGGVTKTIFESAPMPVLLSH